MHRLLQTQLLQARNGTETDWDRFVESVEQTYCQMDNERRGIVRSMRMMSDEATALTREVEETSATRLQAVLDHVKDAIMTTDEHGSITMLNVTSLRVFKLTETTMLGRSIAELLPLFRGQKLSEALDRMAARADDTQRDLMPHQTVGVRPSGASFSAEMSVSRVTVGNQLLYVICLRDTSERKASVDALRESEARYRRLFENVVEGVYSSTRDGKIIAANPALVAMTGCESVDHLLNTPASSLYVEPKLRQQLLDVLEREGHIVNAEFELRRIDGKVIVVLENAHAIRDEHGVTIGYEGTITDVTERKRAEQQLLQEKDKAQITLRSIGDAVITTDATGRIESLNPTAEALLAIPSENAVGRSLASILNLVTESSRQRLDDPVTVCLRQGKSTKSDDQVLLICGSREVAVTHSAAPIRDAKQEVIGVVVVFHDISRETRLRRAFQHQATHDALTGLKNRREFENYLSELLRRLRSTATTCALLYLDLDQFKLVNDTCGHQAGDQLLRKITGVLQTRVRKGDVVARLGGDEFALLLKDCDAKRAEVIADDVRIAIRDSRFAWNDVTINVGVSIGVVEINSESESIGSIMSAADVACYTAKDSGRNRIHTYQPDKAPERHREMQWIARLMRAVEENRLELFYQPIVAIGNNGDQRHHYELLLRMRTEQGQLILPAEFISAAERYNLMPMIDRWVVQHALGSLAHYRSDGDPRDAYTISINLSGTSLSDDRFLDFVINELQSHDLSSGSVCFEITETAAIANLANVGHFMHELKARGCQFSLDDFGSGLSSFLYLKSLPVDYLKIDGQFVQNITNDTVDRSMVEAIRQVGHAIGVKTIAERVESPQILLCLSELGIDYAQGNYIAYPESVESLSRITRSTPRLKASTASNF
jgi:diguanylate cyclase (GGDEF)-like protein/PAS domain S-box-containing protein